MNLEEQQKTTTSPVEFEPQKRSLAGFLGRVSTCIRNANACVADRRVGDLESVRKELDVAWERYDSFYENLPEGELDRVQDRYTEIVVQYEECIKRINDCLTQMKKTSTKRKSAKSAPSSKQSRSKDLRRDIEMKKVI